MAARARPTSTDPADFFDALAESYDELMNASPGNAVVRNAFRDYVVQFAGTGGLLIDFGCATGADAAWYAARGYDVIAYDIAPQMVAMLRVRHAADVARGAITPVAGGLDVLRDAVKRVGPASAIAANFAVLNHVPNLSALLTELAEYLGPSGVIVASMNSPWYWGDLRAGWWWRGLPSVLRTGVLEFHGAVTTYRHWPSALRRAAAPRFAVSDVTTASALRGRRLGLFADPLVFVVLRKVA